MATTWTDADPLAFLANVTSAGRRRDAQVLLDLMREVTGLEPKMFGPSIVGFGEYAYQYASGHSGIAPATGFSPHTAGTGCLNIKDLTKVDLDVLTGIVRTSFKTLTAGTYGKRANEG